MSRMITQPDPKESATTYSWCWLITRKDGVTLGFTDHDRSLDFEGHRFDPEGAFDATALASKGDLAPDNSEVMGAIDSERITFEDIHAGRYGEASVTIWRVDWRNPDHRRITFSGHIGEITYDAMRFTAELRGLSDPLSRSHGRYYLKSCGADLGDGACGVDLAQENARHRLRVKRSMDRQSFYIEKLDNLEDGWFSFGTVVVESGANQGLRRRLNQDKTHFGERYLTFHEPLPFDLESAAEITLIVGCNKTAEQCKERFNNLINFQGFPFIPGEDWMLAYPKGNA